jgi:drug/metabolite transporter (DMT)-like permease
MSDINTLLLVLSQAGMTLYPLLIKLVPTNLETQTAIRFISYSILALLGSFLTDKSILSYSVLEYMGFGLINLCHVVASYSCFRMLSSGMSYTLFYTYPIFNMLGRMLFYGDRVRPVNFIYIGIAFLGVYILTRGTNVMPSTTQKPITAENKDHSLENQVQGLLASNPLLIGALMGILSAITESTMYLLVKSASPATSAFQQISRFYLFGGILGIIFLGYTLLTKDVDKTKIITEEETTSSNMLSNNMFFNVDTLDFQMSWKPLLEMILFNALVGFVGYTVLYYVIPRTGTIQFNIYIFLGIIFSYMWGYLLNGETIPTQNLLGLLLILFAIFMVNRN